MKGKPNHSTAVKQRGTVTVPAVLLTNPKYPHNVAAALRGCSCFGIDTLIWTGDRTPLSPELGERLPREERMKGYAHVGFRQTDRPFELFTSEVVPVCVELSPSSEVLTTFQHPENAVYVFGPEDGSVPQVYRRFCHRFVHIPSHYCLNLAAAVNVVLYDRMMKRQLSGAAPILPMKEMLHEHRGVIDIKGWDGQ